MNPWWIHQNRFTTPTLKPMAGKRKPTRVAKRRIMTKVRRVGNKVFRIVWHNGRLRYIYVTETIRRPIDYSRIEPCLFQGETPRQFPFFADAVVNLEQRLNLPYNPDQLRGYLWVPIPDVPDVLPSIEWLDMVVGTIIGWKKAGWSILVHCQAGISRSSLVAMAYMMKAYGFSLNKALEVLRERRPKANPNPGFVKLLEEYQAHLAKCADS